MRNLKSTIEKPVTFVVALILCGALWRLFSTGAPQSTQVVEGDDRTQVVLAIIYSFVGIICLFQFRATCRGLFRNLFLVAILVLACVSTVWADSPDVAIRRSLGLVGSSLFGVYLGTR